MKEVEFWSLVVNALKEIMLYLIGDNRSLISFNEICELVEKIKSILIGRIFNALTNLGIIMEFIKLMKNYLCDIVIRLHCGRKVWG